MVVIRLARGGAKKRPFYHIVAADKQNRRDGRFIERVGYYNPVATGNENGLNIAVDRVTYWTGKGAQVSPSVQRLLKSFVAKVAGPRPDPVADGSPRDPSRSGRWRRAAPAAIRSACRGRHCARGQSS